MRLLITWKIAAEIKNAEIELPEAEARELLAALKHHYIYISEAEEIPQ